ncbi:hypothetical protein [Streptomyces lichenis]
MLGGFESWAREGFAYGTADGTRTGPVDPLTAPAHAADGDRGCGC